TVSASARSAMVASVMFPFPASTFSSSRSGTPERSASCSIESPRCARSRATLGPIRSRNSTSRFVVVVRRRMGVPPQSMLLSCSPLVSARALRLPTHCCDVPADGALQQECLPVLRLEDHRQELVDLLSHLSLADPPASSEHCDRAGRAAMQGSLDHFT